MQWHRDNPPSTSKHIANSSIDKPNWKNVFVWTNFIWKQILTMFLQLHYHQKLTITSTCANKKKWSEIAGWILLQQINLIPVCWLCIVNIDWKVSMLDKIATILIYSSWNNWCTFPDSGNKTCNQFFGIHIVHFNLIWQHFRFINNAYTFAWQLVVATANWETSYLNVSRQQNFCSTRNVHRCQQIHLQVFRNVCVCAYFLSRSRCNSTARNSNSLVNRSGDNGIASIETWNRLLTTVDKPTANSCITDMILT